MILSHLHGFVFVKGKKVGGTTVEIALSTICGPDDIATAITPVDEVERFRIGAKCQNFAYEPDFEVEYRRLIESGNISEAKSLRAASREVSRYVNHMSLSEIEELTTFNPRDFTLIICERNPYRKIISLANMDIGFSSYDGAPMRNPLRRIRRAISKHFKTGAFRQVRNLPLYSSENSYRETIILKQEELNQNLTELFVRFGQAPLQTWPRAKAGTKMTDEAIRSLFSRRQLDLINEEFADEFQRFGYEMI